MRIVLLQDVRGVGRKNEVREVSDGYARHFLIAKKLALPATPEALTKAADAESREEALMKRVRDAARRLAGDPLRFTVNTDERGTLFGGINRDDILAALRKKGYEVAAVELPHAIKTAGEYTIAVRFPRGITGAATVMVQPPSR